jgi:hypothetical protein
MRIRKPRTAAEWLGTTSASLLALLLLAVGSYAVFRPVQDHEPRPASQQSDKMLPAIPTVTEIKPGSQRHSDGRTFLIGIADKCATQDVFYVNAAPFTPNGEYTAHIQSADGTYDSGNLVGDGATADEDGTVINLPLKCGGFSPGTYTFAVTDSTTHNSMSFQFMSVMLGK